LKGARLRQSITPEEKIGIKGYNVREFNAFFQKDKKNYGMDSTAV
jgi:hypothetical protein